jgi:hypothetical protein
MAMCESLSLDVASDRERLWARVVACIPRDEIARALESYDDKQLSKDLEPSPRVAAEIAIAVLETA